MEARLGSGNTRGLIQERGDATLASMIAARLRLAIIRGDLAPGERLKLGQLRETFDVSLSPLREALSRLGSEGFLVIEDQRGYRVPPVSEKNLDEIVRLRRDFETYALREAVLKRNLDWETAVTAALYRLQRTQRNAPDELDMWEERHREFHLTLIAASEMPLLLNMCGMLHDHFDRYRRVFLATSPDSRVPTEHQRIAEAAIDGRTEEACDLLRQHIEWAGDNARRAVALAGNHIHAPGSGATPGSGPRALSLRQTAGD
jgi:GntR family transcriptional regulator, carbon starvation induced regulator